jgi:hypothetical protein
MSNSSQTYAGKFVGSLFTVALLMLAAYGITKWVGGEPGAIREWVIGLFVLWWLVVVVILPWDLHFTARTLLVDAARSRKDGITVADADIAYVARWAKLSLWLAIVLHIVSAGGFYLLAALDIYHLGYYAAAASILAMGLRPAGRAYDFLIERLGSIGREVRHPRDDVNALRQKIEGIDDRVKELVQRLDVKETASWAAQVEARLTTGAAEVEKLRAAAEDARRENEDAHRQLARDAEGAAARMAEDARVLNNVRELVRFFKEA